MKENSVVAFVPILETAPHVILSGAGFEPHERIGKIVFRQVVLWRKVIGLGLPALANQLGDLIALVHVMRDGAQVVEELAQQIPTALTLYHFGAEQEIAGILHSSLEKESLTAVQPDVTQALVLQRLRPIGCFGRRRKPAFINPSAMRSECVEIIGMES
jgi:hypothetical protein